MAHTLDAETLSAEMAEISRLNLAFYKLGKSEDTSAKAYFKQCNTIYSIRGKISSSYSFNPQSAHQRLRALDIEDRRNKLITSFAQKLLTEINGLYPGRSSLVMVFGLTDAGNPSIEIKFEGIPLHKRGLMCQPLASKVKALADCLDHAPRIPGPIRNFAIGYADKIPATSPEEAIWKWLCLRHHNYAQDLAKLEPGSDLVIPKHSALETILNSATVREMHDTRECLADACGLICPAKPKV